MSVSNSSARLGFIGLGNMGRPMAANLCRKGFSLVVHDINREPVKTLASLGAQPADRVSDVAAACDVVFTMLPGSSSVEDVFLGPYGLIANGRPRSTFVDMSTVDPHVTDKVAAAAAAQGHGFVDAPVG